ncbi:hypothetical protein LDENG_00263650 [Lucifuga dentata]|nr:hypothetical protein LDENG_00263650 [Lucifuga dentata]
MSFSCLGFVLLLCFPGVLYAQSASRSCTAPKLDGGYFVPEQVSYHHRTQLIYACDSGLKPTVEGWWATITCENGKWSHKPECINEKSCFSPNIPNGKPLKRLYNDGEEIRVTCDKGYVHKHQDASAECRNGMWWSVPVCEKSSDACVDPPQILNAVIIHDEHQDMFPVRSRVQYECREGYVVEGAQRTQSLSCIAGGWSEGQPCRRESRPGSGHDENPPAVGGTGVSISSGLNDRERERQITAISRCGHKPLIQNGEIVETGEMFLKYQCANFYKLEGPEEVQCYSDGTWSQLPICKETFCAVDTTTYSWLKAFFGVKYVRDGEKVRFECEKLAKWWFDHYSVGQCTNGRMTFSKCCTWFDIKTNNC